MILDGIKVSAHMRRRPHSEKIAETTSLLLGYVRTERCRQQEAALNRMALQLIYVIESDRLDGWPDAERARVTESF